MANFSIANRRYKALVATWDYRPGVRWNIGGNWTYSELTGNWEGSNPNNSGPVLSPIGNYERTRPEGAAVPYGNLYDDTPHRIQAWGNYRFDLKRAGSLVLGGIARFESGSNWSRTAGVPLADDPDYNNEVDQPPYDLMVIDTGLIGHLDSTQIIIDNGSVQVLPRTICDWDDSGSIDISDLNCMVEYLFGAYDPTACPYQFCDINRTGQVDIGDLTYLVEYLFAGGPPPH